MAVTPALHHDLACHAKTPGHCDACVATPLASPAEPGTALEAPSLVVVGEMPPCDPAREHRVATAPTRGRSPPPA
jgi:hypothetical protein